MNDEARMTKKHGPLRGFSPGRRAADCQSAIPQTGSLRQPFEALSVLVHPERRSRGGKLEKGLDRQRRANATPVICCTRWLLARRARSDAPYHAGRAAGLFDFVAHFGVHVHGRAGTGSGQIHPDVFEMPCRNYICFSYFERRQSGKKGAPGLSWFCKEW